MVKQGNTGQTLAQFFWKHSATVLGLAYAYTSALGVIYLYSLFRRFGMNIMDFVEATDVLFAAFKAPLGVVVSLPVMLRLGASLISGPVAKWPFWRRILLVAGVLVGLIFPSVIMGSVDGNRLRDRGGTKVVVELKESDHLLGSYALEGDTTLIWTTQDFAFFYNHETQRLRFVPVANIVSIQVLPSAPSEVSTSMLDRLVNALGLFTPPDRGEPWHSNPTLKN